MRPRAAKHGGLSIIELLVVMALMGILFALLAPSMQSIGGGTDLTAAADLTAAQLRLARQLAISRNRNTELRLLAHQDESGTTRIRSLAIYVDAEEAGLPHTPHSRPQRLPVSVTLDEGAALSPLLQQVDQRTGSELGLQLPAVGLDYTAYLIRFRPNGSAEVPEDNAQNFFTLRPARSDVASGQLPANHAVIQILPKNGQIRVFRP